MSARKGRKNRPLTERTRLDWIGLDSIQSDREITYTPSSIVMDKGRRAGLVNALPPPRVPFLYSSTNSTGGYQHAASSPSALETWSLPEASSSGESRPSTRKVVGSVPAAVAAALRYLSTR